MVITLPIVGITLSFCGLIASSLAIAAGESVSDPTRISLLVAGGIGLVTCVMLIAVCGTMAFFGTGQRLHISYERDGS